MEKKSSIIARKVEELEQKVRLLEQLVDDLTRRIDVAGRDLAPRRGMGNPARNTADLVHAAGPAARYEIGDREYLPVIMP
ncbi:MAG: hypothetical protein ACOC8N_00310 [Spirochaetota bacterium]